MRTSSERLRGGLLLYDYKSLKSLAETSGLSADRTIKFLLPTLVLPLVFIKYNLILSLLLLLILLRAPHFVLWYFSKERQKKIRQELPLAIPQLKWALSVNPVPKAICSVNSGELASVFERFCVRYHRGDSFDSSLTSISIFPELNELSKRLKVIYKTGEGVKLLDLYSDKIAAENLSLARQSAARMQIFAVVYTSLIAVLPAMYSGLSVYSPGGNVLPLSLLAGLGLVILWKLVD